MVVRWILPVPALCGELEGLSTLLDRKCPTGVWHLGSTQYMVTVHQPGLTPKSPRQSLLCACPVPTLSLLGAAGGDCQDQREAQHIREPGTGGWEVGWKSRNCGQFHKKMSSICC